MNTGATSSSTLHSRTNSCCSDETSSRHTEAVKMDHSRTSSYCSDETSSRNTEAVKIVISHFRDLIGVHHLQAESVVATTPRVTQNTWLEPGQRDTNFSRNLLTERQVHQGDLLRLIRLIVWNIILGDKKEVSINQQRRFLLSDKAVLSDAGMEENAQKLIAYGSQLLDIRSDFDRKMKRSRITFVATLIAASVTMFSKPNNFFLATVCSCASFVWLTKRYADGYFSENRTVTLLELAISDVSNELNLSEDPVA